MERRATGHAQVDQKPCEAGMMEKAQVQHAPFITECLYEAAQESGAYEHVKVDFEYARAKITRLLLHEAICFVEPNRGCILAVATPMWCSPTIVVTELLLYVKPKHRQLELANNLVSALLCEARRLGAAEVRAGQSLGIVPEAVRKLYTGWGFDQVGEVYSLKL